MTSLQHLTLLLAMLSAVYAQPLTCMSGWLPTLTVDATNQTITRCCQVQLAQLPAIDVEFYCENLLGLTTNSQIVAKSMSIRTANDNVVALQASARAFSMIATSAGPQVVLLGGASGYGSIAWYDGFNGTANVYNFSSLTASPGCVGLNADGSWQVVSCTDLRRPFLCAYDLVPPVTVPPTPAPPTAAPTAVPPAAPLATRPPTSSILPPCPSGWILWNSTGKCYLLATPVGGLRQQDAVSYCASLFPNATLTSSLTSDETTALSTLMQGTALPAAFIGGVFMSYGGLGVWYEDNIWYSNWSSASSPSWPTSSNGFYSNWNFAEPSMSFGCVAIDRFGRWMAQSCQDSLPFICSMMDTTTATLTTSVPPTTGLMVTTPVPTTSTSSAPMSCPSGWYPSTATRRCYRILTSPQITAADLERTCNQQLSTNTQQPFVHSAPCMNDAENDFVSLLLRTQSVPSALIGVSFVLNGTSGMCLDGATDYDASFALAHFAAGEPSRSGGCVMLRSDGRWMYSPCGIGQAAYVCSYSFDANSGANVPTTAPPATAAPQAIVPLSQRIASLNGLQNIVVARGTVGVYVIQSAGGPIDGLLLLFSPSALCIGGVRDDLVSAIRNNTLTITHTMVVNNGVVCVSSDGQSFVATALGFQVVDAKPMGLLSLSQSLYAPPQRRVNYATSDIANVLSLPRRSSGTFQIAGTGSAFGAITSVRIASSISCQNNTYSLSMLDIQASNSMFTLTSVTVEPQSQSALNPFLNDQQTFPPVYYYLCVAISSTAAYTRVPNVTFSLTPEYVAVDQLVVVDPNNVGLSSMSRSVNVAQFSSPRIALVGQQIKTGMEVLLSYDPQSCSRQQQSPSNSLLETQLPSFLYTAAPVNFAMIDTDANASTAAMFLPYVQLNLNHTAMYGVDLLVSSQTMYVCLAHSATEPFYPTALTVTVYRQIIAAAAPDGQLPQTADLALNTGFAGLLRLWGLDTSQWSLETISSAQIGFAEAPGGSTPIGPLTLQCSNTSTFYNQRALNVIAGSSTNSSLDDSVRSGNLSSRVLVVIPPGFFYRQTSRRMRLCLSVPHPFDTTNRVFVPTTATVDIRPVQLLFIGKYGVGSVGASFSTTISLPENSDNVVFPLLGYGIRSDMSLFLSNVPCISQANTHDTGYMPSISILNISIMQPYDVPLSFRNTSGSPQDVASNAFIVITQQNHTNIDMANSVFGTSRSPKYVCLWAPQTQNLVYSTPFMLTVRRPSVTSIQDAVGNSPAVITYALFDDLLVSGVGLQENRSAFIPALDCTNTSSYLWRSPVVLSPVPSLLLQPNSPLRSRFVDFQSMNGSWFLPIGQAQSVRIGTQMPTDGMLKRFQWCVNYDISDAHYGFEPTGIPYRLFVPSATGFITDAFPNMAMSTLSIPREDPILGQWSKASIVGPIVDNSVKTGNPLYMFLTEPRLPCSSLKNYIITSNSSDRFIVAFNGKILLLPAHVSVAGTYKLCVSAVYPPIQSTENVEAALQFVELLGLSVVVQQPTYRLFTLNGTTLITLAQGDSSLVAVDGIGLTAAARLRLLDTTASGNGASCGSLPMPGGIGDIVIRPVYPNQTIFGLTATHFYINVDHFESRAIPVGSYYVCMLPNRAEQWQLSSVRVTVIAHQRRPTTYNYFSSDPLYDVAAVRSAFPSKVIIPSSVAQTPSRVNIVGTFRREVSLQLWCYNGNGSQPIPCGDNKRVMFVRPLPDDSDPCFSDDEDEDWENLRGPLVMKSGVVTVPRYISTNYSYVPNLADPWVLCVETSPQFWRRPATPRFVLEFTTVVVTGILLQPDNPTNSSAWLSSVQAAPSPQNGFTNIVLYAGDVSQVFYLNGFGIQFGLQLRFGQSCSTQGPMNNPLLFTTPISTGDDLGSFVIPSSYFTQLEPNVLAMCVSSDGVFFNATNITLEVRPSRIIQDASISLYGTRHAVSEALADTLVVPMKSRGQVDLSALHPKDGSSVNLGTGAQVMLSSSCWYNSNNLPILQVADNSIISVSYKHTSVATPNSLLVCVRRVRWAQDNNGTWQMTFVSPLFTESKLYFKVAAISLSSISVNPRLVGAEADHDVTQILFNARGTDLLVPLQFAFQPGAGTSSSGILGALDDVNILSFFNLAQFQVGRPCNQRAPSAVSARLGTLATQTATFANGSVTIAPDGLQGFQAPLRVDVNFVADPWNPYSLCMAIDGGRHYVSVGIAYFTATWAPSLFALEQEQSFTQSVTVFESTSLYVPFTDSRYDARIITSRTSDFVDNELSRLLNRFTVSALWTGFVGNVGYAQEGTLYIPSQIILDGEVVPSTLQATASVAARNKLLFSYDITATNIDTGITVSLSSMTLRCLENSLTQIVVNRQESGRSFAVPLSGNCNQGINAGAVLRMAPSCNASTIRTSYVADLLIDNSYQLNMPAQFPYIPNGVYQLCLRKYLPLRFSSVLGMESEYLATAVSAQVTREVIIDQIDGLSSGVLTGYIGDAYVATLSGAGVATASIVVSLVQVPVGFDSVGINGVFDTMCNPVLGYVDAAGNPLSNNTLLDWFPVQGGILVIPATSNIPPLNSAYLPNLYMVCASFDFGLSFHVVGGPLFYTLVPPTVTGVQWNLPLGAQLYDKNTTPNAAQLLRLSADTRTPLGNWVPAKMQRLGSGVGAADLFLNTSSVSYFIGNGIGGRSRRTTPLIVAMVRSDTVGYRCNGQVPPDAVVGTWTINGNNGALQGLFYAPAALSSSFGTQYLLCTSIDGVGYYSGNAVVSTTLDWMKTAHGVAGSSSVWASSLSSYVSLPLLLYSQQSIQPTRFAADITVNLLIALLPNVSNWNGSLPATTLDLVQGRIADAISYHPSVVALSYEPSSACINTGRPAVCGVLSVKLLCPGLNATSSSAQGVVSLYATMMQAILSNTSGFMQGLIGDTLQSRVTVAVVATTILLDDGSSITQGPLDDETPAIAANLSTLRSIATNYYAINGNRLNDLSTDDMQPKATWSAIPVIIMFPFLLIFATYQVFLRYFDIITPEELATREQQSRDQLAARRERKTLSIRTGQGRDLLNALAEAGAELRGSALEAKDQLHQNMKESGQELKEYLEKNADVISTKVADAATFTKNTIQSAVTPKPTV